MPPSTRPFRFMFFLPRSTNDSVHADARIFRTNCFRRCDMSSEETWKKSREAREDSPHITLILQPHRLQIFLNARIPLPTGLEQLNGIAVGIFYLYLLATGTNFHFVPEMKSRFFHALDLCGQIVYPKHDAIPTSGFLLPTIRHL